jgi:hypothetical protein
VKNDINYIGQGIGYTQGVGMSYEVWYFAELVKKIFKKYKLENQKVVMMYFKIQI